MLEVGLAHQLTVIARRVHRLIGRQCHAGCIFGVDDGIVPQPAERCRYDSLAETFVRNIGDVVYDEALLGGCGIQVLATELQATRALALARVRSPQHAVVVEMLPEILRVRITVQVTADHGLWLVPLGDFGCQYSVLETRPGVEPDEVHEIRAQQQQLRHPGVVTAVFRQVAATAGLGFGFARRVRKVRVQCLRAIAAGSDRRLLDVDAFAVRIRRRKDQCR